MDWNHGITLFVGHLIQEGKKSSTIKSYLSAIRVVLKIDGHEIATDSYVLTVLVKACKLKNDKILARFPICHSMLEILIKQLPVILDGQQYLMTLYKALFLTTYVGLFRIGEVTQSPHVIKARDVHIAKNKCKVMFVLKSSKTHTEADQPQVVKISSEASITSTKLGIDLFKKEWLVRKSCPYHALREYLAIRGSFVEHNEQFFIFRDRSAVTPANMRDILHRMLTIAGFDYMVYSVHSLRRGRAFDLLQYGVSVEMIKKIGRWRSNTVFAYLRQL